MLAAIVQPVLAAVLASSAVPKPFHGGLGLGAGSGPDDTGLFFSFTGFFGYSATRWLDTRVVLIAHKNLAAIVPPKEPMLDAKAALAGVHLHVPVLGRVELTGAAAVGIGRVSEPPPSEFGVSGGGGIDLAWQYAVGFRVPAAPAWFAFEWVWTQFARYPKPDRLASLEGRIDGLVVSLGAAMF